MAATGAGARFILEVFAFAIIRAMELTTILNHCYPHRGATLSLLGRTRRSMS
jgi:hypothetical protein